MGHTNTSTNITLKAPKMGGMSDHLIRQRRNLIITSLIVSFILYTDVQISKIAIFGIEIQTPKQQALMNSLWAIWLYFFVRYYQYLRIEPEKGFWGICMYKVQINIAKMVEAYINDETKYGSRTNNGVIIPNIKKKSFLKWEYVINDYSTQLGMDKVIDRVEIPLYRFVLPIMKGVLNTIFNTAKFSDNILPILLATFTALFGFYKSPYFTKLIKLF